MTAIVVEKNLTEKRDKRAKSIAAMGLVNRDGARFRVSTPSLRGKQASYDVWRDESGKIRCNCLEFEEAAVTDSGFRCEHILAVKYALVAKNTEPATKQPIEVETEVKVVSEDTSATEPIDLGSPNADLGLNKSEVRNSKSQTSSNGEQKIVENSADVLTNGQVKANEAVDQQLANIGDKKMTQENLRNNFVAAEENAETGETPNNVLNFTTTLKELRKNVDPQLVKQREGWRDRNGNTHYVDYVEWHTVADILDENAPNWSHTVKDIRQIGDIFTVTVAITIDGVTREGIGTGTADSELGIKKAEHDALKRAAVKFGIARDLYKKESDAIEHAGAVPPPTDGGYPSNPIARSLSDLVTAKQLGMIRALARELGVDPDEECNSAMNCKTDELSRKAASALIQHLQDMQKGNQAENNFPMRRAS